ncbi:hypothetical protein KKA14_14780, partial [bacterium]|nr:hypothetical protein [bacterium]
MLKKTAGFSKEIPVENIETIVSLVVSNIEDHLLNFLTVGSSFGPFSEQSLKRDSAESNVQPVTDSEESIVEIEKQPKEKVKISLKRFVMALPVIVAAIVALIILNPFTEEFQAKYIQQMRYETKIKPFQKDLKKKGITLLNSNIYFKYLTSNQLQKVNTNDGLSLYPPQNFNISILLKSGTNEKKAQQFRSVIKYQSLLIWVIKLDDTFVLFETDNTNNEIYQGSDPYQTYIYAEINWKTLNRQIMRYHEKSGRINTIEYKGALLVFSNGTYREFLNNMPSQNDKPITSLSDYLNQLSIHNLFDAGEILEKHGLDFFVIGEMQP